MIFVVTVVTDATGEEFAVSFESGQPAVIYPDEVDGFAFDGWQVPEDLEASVDTDNSLSFTMPEKDLKVTALYIEQEPQEEEEEEEEEEAPEEEPEEEEEGEEEAEGLPEDGTDEEKAAAKEKAVTYAVVPASKDVMIDGGAKWNGTQFVAAGGKKVTISAKQYGDLFFEGFNVIRDDTGEQIKTKKVASSSVVYTFKMPNSSVTVNAVYSALANNQVEVYNGAGSGTYTEGTTVKITANTAPAGYRFSRWNVITGNVTPGNAEAAQTMFTMPAEAVQVEALYVPIDYTLSVASGKGAGVFHKGDRATIEANWPASGKEFDVWRVNTGNAQVSAPDRFYSSVIMPAANVTVTATYKDGPSPAYNAIQGIDPNGEYLKNTTITFTAVGNGMSNTNPNPGDYRYRPASYQISGVPGSWSNPPYTTSMSITAAGTYTLTVTYAKEIFDGSTWRADGTYDTKSVTFRVVNAMAVATGDESPIGLIVGVALAALAVIIAAVVFLVIRRRRR